MLVPPLNIPLPPSRLAVSCLYIPGSGRLGADVLPLSRGVVWRALLADGPWAAGLLLLPRAVPGAALHTGAAKSQGLGGATRHAWLCSRRVMAGRVRIPARCSWHSLLCSERGGFGHARKRGLPARWLRSKLSWSACGCTRDVSDSAQQHDARLLGAAHRSSTQKTVAPAVFTSIQVNQVSLPIALQASLSTHHEQRMVL